MRGFKSFERVSPQKISQRAFVRNMPLVVVFTPGELVDLQVIANTWDTVPKTVAWWLVANELAKMRGRNFQELPWAYQTRYELAKIGRIHRQSLTPRERLAYAETKEPAQEDPEQFGPDPSELLHVQTDDGDTGGSLDRVGPENGGGPGDGER